MQISRQTFMQIQERPLRLQGEVDLPNLNREVASLVRVEPVQVEGTIEKIDDQRYLLTVDQETAATFVCSRCLEPFSVPLKTHWEEQLALTTSSEQEELVPLGDYLALDEWVREALLLQVPFAPLCQVDCQGLCPECGVNHNRESCDCQVENIDPRLAKLKEFGRSNS
jgi:uncharacterized protein